MSRGLTIADLVQQVLYAMYKVRLDVSDSVEGSYHCHSNKFKEVVMEANFVLQEFQKEQDWNFLRDRWEIGISRNPHHSIQEFELPEDVYRVCTGYNDAIRLHQSFDPRPIIQVPFVSARSGNKPNIEMFNDWGELNTVNRDVAAFVVGDTITFTRRWFHHEEGLLVETDVIRRIEPLHICDDSCPAHCPKAYDEVHFRWMPDPYYFIVRTAAKRAEGDPSITERVQSLTDEGAKILSAIRENDSAHTTEDVYETSELGYIGIY